MGLDKPTTRRDGLKIIQQLAGGRNLPEEISEQILAKTDGVALFVEELTKAVLESGQLKQTRGCVKDVSGDEHGVLASAQRLTAPIRHIIIHLSLCPTSVKSAKSPIVYIRRVRAAGRSQNDAVGPHDLVSDEKQASY